jgi:prepilin-type N-terminal cleavage/methylation domain-containing protein
LKRCGFTLLEVMLAVLILGTALVALTRMLILGRLSADADAKRIVALSILRHEADLVHARGYSGVATEAPATVASQSGYERSITVTDAGSGLKLVTVTVAWDSPTGKAVSESVQFLVGDALLPVRSWEVP